MRLAHPLRTASASAEVIHPMVEGVEGARELAVCLRRARGRSAGLCQGARESVPGRHAADGRAPRRRLAEGGDLSECAVPATAEAQASAEQEAGARVVRRRRCHGMLLAGCGGLEAGFPSEEGRVGKS